MVNNTRTVEFSRMDDATAAEMELIRDEAAIHRRDHWLGTVVRLLESMKATRSVTASIATSIRCNPRPARTGRAPVSIW